MSPRIPYFLKLCPKIEMGAELVIVGCTEVPLVLLESDIQDPLVDPTWVLALNAVEVAIFDKNDSKKLNS